MGPLLGSAPPSSAGSPVFSKGPNRSPEHSSTQARAQKAEEKVSQAREPASTGPGEFLGGSAGVSSQLPGPSSGPGGCPVPGLTPCGGRPLTSASLACPGAAQLRATGAHAERRGRPSQGRSGASPPNLLNLVSAGAIPEGGRGQRPQGLGLLAEDSGSPGEEAPSGVPELARGGRFVPSRGPGDVPLFPSPAFGASALTPPFPGRTGKPRARHPLRSAAALLVLVPSGETRGSPGGSRSRYKLQGQEEERAGSSHSSRPGRTHPRPPWAPRAGGGPATLRRCPAAPGPEPPPPGARPALPREARPPGPALSPPPRPHPRRHRGD
ncbi:basic proline-rich protein-like [Choloepus didactylus]|uniref:basic proline-rich protein-like n=1 Tax=Choloepus didactylus TaxID=27675 RepID=UPI00189D5F28|nr:basic proline-rich protein-like [Choloepus didactylus]